MRLLVVGLLLSGLAAVVPAARGAEGETCRGKPATIVDLEERASITGTNGSDVIVGGENARVRAGGGGDLICVISGLVNGEEGRDLVSATGTDEGDFVKAIGIEWFDIALGDGSDHVKVRWSSSPRRRGTIDLGVAGSGEDDLGGLTVIAMRAVDVDLEDGLMQVDRGSRIYLNGVTEVVAAAPRVRIQGDAADNDLFGDACELVLLGGAGDDLLAMAQHYRQDGRACGTAVRRAYGGRDGDLLWGRESDDVLIGGPGRDRANGYAGRDRCVAEIETSCER